MCSAKPWLWLPSGKVADSRPQGSSLWIPAMALLTQFGCKAKRVIGERLPQAYEEDRRAPPAPTGREHELRPTMQLRNNPGLLS
ncbi:hypothetical protein AVEN_208682-1 [Araneus ventricosus]|uniref:Uncharacterized protein n=1 Tax=Araneus ventricosus TaxID=182803 RepID=A0A4Y2KY85_ARAVE|nr:hypothetical protein AVEN_208682-1 [Araneus ventricosus]